LFHTTNDLEKPIREEEELGCDEEEEEKESNLKRGKNREK
jgi:hypothetical protein